MQKLEGAEGLLAQPERLLAEERRRLLTFAVVGGGPTGCEFCGELSDFVRNDLRRFYPKLAPLVRIILIHRGKTLLPDFGESLQQAAQEFLETQGIEVVLETTVDEVGKQQVLIADKNHGSDKKALPCGLVVWAAGQIGQDLVRDLHKAIPRQEELAASEAHESREFGGVGFQHLIFTGAKNLVL